MSLRWRLTLWYGAALAVLMLLLGTAVYLALSHRLMARTDQELDEELEELALEIELARDLDEVKRHLLERFSDHETFDFQVLSESNPPIFQSARLRQGAIPTDVDWPRTSGVVRTVETHPSLGEIRIASQRVSALGQDLLLQVAARLTNDRRELADLAQLLLSVGPLGLLAALSIGYVLVRQALAPVAQMTAVAERISGSSLAERVPSLNSDDELGRLAATFNRMLDRLKSAVNELQRFTADAAHELRTPLAVLRSEVEVALRTRRTPEEYEKTLWITLGEIERLTRLTNQLLLLSRQDAGLAAVKREPVELEPLIQGACDQLANQAADRGVSIQFAGKPCATLLGDELQLFQLVFNLIDNGIKYTPSGRRVQVDLSEHAGVVEVRIADTGVGIPAAHLPHVTRRFYRVDASRNRESGGAGLGLAICESIAHGHGGTMTIASAVGEGTCVTIRLPVKRLPAVPSQNEPPQPTAVELPRDASMPPAAVPSPR